MSKSSIIPFNVGVMNKILFSVETSSSSILFMHSLNAVTTPAPSEIVSFFVEIPATPAIFAILAASVSGTTFVLTNSPDNLAKGNPNASWLSSLSILKSWLLSLSYFTVSHTNFVEPFVYPSFLEKSPKPSMSSLATFISPFNPFCTVVSSPSNIDVFASFLYTSSNLGK